jgi:hypothetical protein
MESLYASLADELGVPVTALPAPPSHPPTPFPLYGVPFEVVREPQSFHVKRLGPHRVRANVYDYHSVPRSPIRHPMMIRRDSFMAADADALSPTTSPTAISAVPATPTHPPIPPPLIIPATVSTVTLPLSPSSPLSFHMLRRRPSPRERSLRELRVKESEACLQKCYEKQTLAYLDGDLYRPIVPMKSTKRSATWGTGDYGRC